MKKLFHDWLTGPNNDNFELWRAMSLALFLVGMGLAIYAVVGRGDEFNLEEFAWGGGWLLLFASGSTGLKDFVSSRAKKEAT